MNEIRASSTRALVPCALLATLVLAAPTARAEGVQATAALPQALTLEAAVRRVLERAPELRLSAAQAERAADALRETRALNLPQIVTGTGLAYNNGFPLSIEGSAPSIVQLGMSQSVLSKRNRNLIREAEESLKGARIAPEATRNDLAARTVLLYVELHQARKLERVWQGRHEATERSARLSESLVEAGRTRPVDATQARAAAAAAAQQLLVARERIALAESELRQLLGFAPGAPIETVEPRLEEMALDATPQVLHQRALEANPELRQAESTVRAKEFHVEAERGEYLPRVELISQYALFSRTNNYHQYFNRFTRNNFLVGLSVQVPIFNGNRTAARVAASRHEVDEARYGLERQKSQLRLEIERSASRLRIARGAADLARVEAAAAAESLEVSESLFEGGRIGARELETARLAMHEKEIGVLDAEVAVWQHRVDLLRLTGTLAGMF